MAGRSTFNPPITKQNTDEYGGSGEYIYQTGFPILDVFFDGYATLLKMQRDIITTPNAIYRQTEVGEADQRIIPLVREELQIGKRQVRQGKTYRIRTVVKEVPIEQRVNLRAEKVEIERRPAAEQSAEGDNEFHEQTIEVQEMYEEPVVGKVILKTEEVVVRKVITERAAVVRDTVRVTDVEVDGADGRETGRRAMALLEAAGDKPGDGEADQGKRKRNQKD